MTMNRNQRDIESEQRVGKLQGLFCEAVSDVLKSSGDKLTFGEIFAALSLTMASWAKSLRKDEREESQQ